jgi:prolyl oligopeptidase
MHDSSVAGNFVAEGSYISFDAKTTEDPTGVRMITLAGLGIAPYELAVTREGILVGFLQEAQSQLFRYQIKDGKWRGIRVALPAKGAMQITASSGRSKYALVVVEDYLRPKTIYKINAGVANAQFIRSGASCFDSAPFVIEQLWAKSVDSTAVPYFVVRKRRIKLDGMNPTILHAYGAYGGKELPVYDPLLGRLWLEKGGIFVLANIRGGAELGPAWHVRKSGRQHTFDDLAAVTKDLMNRGISSSSHIGIRGHSNGAGLMAAMLNMYPGLFSAAVIENGMLDQIDLVSSDDKRTPVSADPWWTDEFGSPAIPAERDFLTKSSPYQNVSRNGEYPPPFVATSTTDTGLVPGISRKYSAKLQSYGIAAYFFESFEGGHGTWVTPTEHAQYEALVYTYMSERLGPFRW